MPTNSRLAHGSKILLGDGGDPTEVFAEIAEIGDFSYGDSAELIDVSHHSSGGFKEYLADIADRDEVQFVTNFDPDDATHTELLGAVRTRRNFRIQAPGDVDGAQFTAIIQNVQRSMPVQGAALTMNITLKPIGAPTSYTV